MKNSFITILCVLTLSGCAKSEIRDYLKSENIDARVKCFDAIDTLYNTDKYSYDSLKLETARFDAELVIRACNSAEATNAFSSEDNYEYILEQIKYQRILSKNKIQSIDSQLVELKNNKIFRQEKLFIVYKSLVKKEHSTELMFFVIDKNYIRRVYPKQVNNSCQWIDYMSNKNIFEL